MTPAALDLGVVVEDVAWVSDGQAVLGVALGDAPRELVRLPYVQVSGVGRMGDVLVVHGRPDQGADAVDVWNVADPAHPRAVRSLRVAPMPVLAPIFLTADAAYVGFAAALPALQGGPRLEVADTVSGAITAVVGPASAPRPLASSWVVLRVPLAPGDAPSAAVFEEPLRNFTAVDGGFAGIDASGAVHWLSLAAAGPPVASAVAPLPAPYLPGGNLREVWLAAGSADGALWLGARDLHQETRGGGGIPMSVERLAEGDPYLLRVTRSGGSLAFAEPRYPKALAGLEVDDVTPAGGDFDVRGWLMGKTPTEVRVARLRLGGDAPSVLRTVDVGEVSLSGLAVSEGDRGRWDAVPPDVAWDGEQVFVDGAVVLTTPVR